MSRDRTTLAILFADISGSTQLYETLGNSSAQAIINRCLAVLGEVAGRYGGVVVKTIGDEIMCTFPGADDAVMAARDMHKAMETLELPEKPGSIGPDLHVGLQIGPVIREEGDVFGDAVNVSARLVAQAKPRQTITTRETIDSLSPDLQASAHHIDTTVIKGKRGELEIFEIVWEKLDVTVMINDEAGTPARQSRIELRLHDVVIEVDGNRPSASLGRQLHNDIVVENKRVSRSHARVEYRRGKFVLIDQSTNGTFVAPDGEKVVQVKRDEIALIGSGIIGLGQELPPDSPDAVHYSVRA